MNRFKRLSILFGSFDLVLGLIVIIGWLVRQQDVLQFRALRAMPFNTAVGFFGIGLAILCISLRLKRLALPLAGLFLGVSSLNLIQQVLGFDLGLDNLLLRLLPKAPFPYLERMPPMTSASFILISLSLLLLREKTPSQARLSTAKFLSGYAILAGIGVLIYYLTGNRSLPPAEAYFLMSPYTALGFIAAGVACLNILWAVSPKENEKLPWFGVGVPLTIVAMAFVLWQALIIEQYRQVGRTVEAVAHGVRDYIQQRVESDIRGLTRLSNRWGLTDHPTRSFWEADASMYLSHTPYARVVTWVDPSFHVRWIVPPTGNEGLHNMNLLIAGRRQTALQEAMHTHAATMSRPVTLVSGEKGSLVYVPIYQANHLVGLIVGAFRIDRLMETLPVELASGYSLAVVEDTSLGRSLDAEVALYRQGVTDRALETDFSQRMPIAIRGVTWYIRVTPSPTTFQRFTSPLPRIIFLTGLLIAAAFSSFYHNEQRIRGARALLEQEIVERQAVEKALRQSEARLIQAQSIARIGFWEYEIATEKVFWSKEMFPLMDFGPEDGQPTLAELLRRFHPEDVPLFLSVVEKAVIDRNAYEFDIRVLQKDGAIQWFHNIGRVECDARGKPVRLLGTFYDITERKESENELRIAKGRLEEINETLRMKQRELMLANERLVQLATTDGLTGLKNHRTFQTKLKVEFDRAVRYSSPLTVLLLDVDHFKLFNDSYGHPAGDEILVKVARLLEATCRSSDLVARYGGEEFAILLPETNSERAYEVAERIRDQISGQTWAERAITVSIGIATLATAMENASDMVSAADTALYASKTQGRNRVTRYEDIVSYSPIEPS